ncbi:MAG: hypothetical protein E7643_05275 [Ruminococcaceae bacterium]|nr:hypothetical protein [Oscillospiraceae bacterium]
MINKQSTSSLLKYAALILIALGAILQTVSIFTAYEEHANYFQTGAVLPVLSVTCVILGALCGVLSALTPGSEATVHSPFSSSYRAIPASIGFLAGGILLLFNSTHTWAFPTFLLFVCAALYSFLSETKSAPSLLVLLGFVTVIACAVGNVYCYFDVSFEMNAPIKVMLQMSLLFSMIYYTGELRFLLAREKPRFYLILTYFALAANALCAISIPSIFGWHFHPCRLRSTLRYVSRAFPHSSSADLPMR